MKKKLLLLTVFVMLLVCLFVVSASAKTIYKDAEGNTLFSYTDENSDFDFDSYEGSFPKTDANGDAITWYITATTTENGDTVHTVESLITLGGAGSINANGAYNFASPVTKKNVVSVNFPDNSGIKSFAFNSFGGNGTRGSNAAALVNNVLFVYCPNTLTTLAGDPFQETSAIVVELDDETPINNIPYKFAHEARNLEAVNIPKAVTVINGSSDRDGAPFFNCYSLSKVTFAEGINLTEIKNSCFKNCSSLSSIVLPEGLQKIGNNAFASCTSLVEISLPNTLKTIMNHAFAWCTSLEVIRMGASFQYFNNTGDNSFTYSTGNVKEIYIPKSFYETAPTTTYQVSYAFHGASANCKFFYCGTVDDFATAKENFLTQTSATKENGKFLDATVITYSQYLANPNSYATGRYVICDYSACDAFYKGVHKEADTVNGSACYLADCGRCNVEKKYIGGDINSATHSFSYAYAYNNGFTTVGTLTTTCANAGCNYCAEKTPDVAELAPIFKNLMYSKREGTEFGIVMTYEIDNDALAVYKSGASTTVNFGVVAIAEEKYNSEKDLVKADGTTEQTNIILADTSDKGAKTVELVIKGAGEQWDAHKATPFYILGYYIDGNTVNYFQSASKTSVTDLTTIKFESTPAEEVA